MPANCPSCRAAIPQTPTPARCPSCNSPLRGAVPKLVIKMPGGIATEFPIRDKLSLGRNPQRNNICGPSLPCKPWDRQRSRPFQSYFSS